MSSSDSDPKALPIPEPPKEPTTYKANCHCGRHQYTLSLPRPLESSPTQVTQCNCSICSRNGYLLIYLQNEDLAFTKGGVEELGAYNFGSNVVKHLFCKTCGSSLLIDGRGSFGFWAVNSRMIREPEVDFEKLEVNHADGRKNGEKYEVK